MGKGRSGIATIGLSPALVALLVAVAAGGDYLLLRELLTRAPLDAGFGF
jgi:hypothetical protein